MNGCIPCIGVGILFLTALSSLRVPPSICKTALLCSVLLPLESFSENRWSEAPLYLRGGRKKGGY